MEEKEANRRVEVGSRRDRKGGQVVAEGVEKVEEKAEEGSNEGGLGPDFLCSWKAEQDARRTRETRKTGTGMNVLMAASLNDYNLCFVCLHGVGMNRMWQYNTCRGGGRSDCGPDQFARASKRTPRCLLCA